MKYHWRKLASLIPGDIEKKIYEGHFKKLHSKWMEDGMPLPPSHLTKQQHLKSWAKKNNLSILVETGTFLGDMVFAMKDDFKKIISIELSNELYSKATQRFKNNKNIEILEGDSGELLKKVIDEIKEPALIWLDGHYSGGITAKGKTECPVFEELDKIFLSPFQHTILIDDARLFVGKNDYPTLEEIKSYVSNKSNSYKIITDKDAIILTPQ
ncbi:MAG: hypothetical protein JWQ96_2695 [Segetibacter sp.]|nr:hypothetical protein [Segetibacter sp.]